MIHHLRHGDVAVRGDVSLFDGPGTGMAAGFGRRARGHDVDLTGGLKMDRSERHRGYVDSHALHAALAGELEALGLDARRDRLGGLAG